MLALVFVGLSSFSGVQRKALTRSGDRSEAAQVTLSELERSKTPVAADTNLFKTTWTQIGAMGPRITTASVQGKKFRYTVRITRTQVAGTDRLIRYSARTTWGARDTLTLGTLVACP